MENISQEEKFTVDDTACAEWTLEKIAEKNKKIAEVESDYEKMVAKYQKWRDDSVDALKSDILYLESLLRPWAEEQLSHGKAKSINLPSGKVGFKSASQEWKFDGEKADAKNKGLLDFAKSSMPEYVKVKKEETVAWAELKKALTVTDNGKVVTADGEIVEGMTVTIGAPTFYTKTA